MLNLRFAKDYVLHRLKAKTRHGVHSPFVYRLIDKVIYDFNTKKADVNLNRIGVSAGLNFNLGAIFK